MTYLVLSAMFMLLKKAEQHSLNFSHLISIVCYVSCSLFKSLNSLHPRSLVHYQKLMEKKKKLMELMTQHSGKSNFQFLCLVCEFLLFDKPLRLSHCLKPSTVSVPLVLAAS